MLYLLISYKKTGRVDLRYVAGSAVGGVLIGAGLGWIAQPSVAYVAGSAEIIKETVNTGKNSVYISKAADGIVQYVGITNNIARRAAEHLSQKGIQIRELMGGLCRFDARAVEQALIEIHGLAKNGGTLLNKINSIAQSNPKYAEALQRGYDLLKSIGYK